MPRLNYSGFLSPKTKANMNQKMPNPNMTSTSNEQAKDKRQQKESSPLNEQNIDNQQSPSLALLIQNHPWAAIGLGFVLGGFLGRNIKRRYQSRAPKLTKHQ